MQRVEADATPAEEWVQQLNATCNRLSTQYLQLLRAASGTVQDPDLHQQQQSAPSQPGQASHQHHDPRAGGSGHAMRSTQDPPPPPLAANVALSLLQCQLAAENLNVAASSLLTLIRTLRLSLLLTDTDTIRAEEELERLHCQELETRALQEAAELEQQLMELRRQSL